MSDEPERAGGDFSARETVSASIPAEVPARVRTACARVAERARSVAIDRAAIPAYAAALPIGAVPAPAAPTATAPTDPAPTDPAPTDPASTAPAPTAPGPPDPATHLTDGSPEQLAAFWLTLDAINFGSGWFPTLRKRPGRSGYHTVAAGIRDRFASAAGPWTADQLARITATEIASTLGQDPGHELMALFAASLADLGRHVGEEHEGSFLAVAEEADGSAAVLATRLAGWDCFADVSCYDGFPVPFYKRAQIAAADLADAGVARWRNPEALTMFADNLVPHVLRLDGILRFDPDLVARIEGGELIAHGSPEEVEIRACALHAVELIVAARPGATAATVDRLLWTRGGGPRYKARPRHRSRTTAY